VIRWPVGDTHFSEWGKETGSPIAARLLGAGCSTSMTGPSQRRSAVWIGPVRNDFGAAFSDFRDHDHAEAVIARCSPEEGTCGPVWPIE